MTTCAGRYQALAATCPGLGGGEAVPGGVMDGDSSVVWMGFRA